MAVRPSILLLEDDVVLARALVRILEDAGFSVAHEVRGDAALGGVAAMFDAAVLDVHVQDLSGLEVLRSIKERSPETECIVVTGRPDLETATDAFRAGAFDYLSKPVEADHLVGVVSAALERGRRRTAAALHHVARVVLTSEDVRTLAERLTALICRQLAADDVSLMVPDADGTLRILHAQGLAPDVASTVRVPLGERIVGRVALSRAPVILNGPPADDERFRGVSTESTVGASIIYPVVAGRRLLAVVNVNRRGPEAPRFHLEELELVGVFAAQLRFWLENQELARRHEATEQLVAMGELVASVAHELSSPLTYLASNLTFVRERFAHLDRVGRALIDGETALLDRWQAIGGRDAVEELQEAIRESDEAVTRIRQLVADLKQMSRPPRSEAQPFALSTAVESARRLAGAELGGCTVSLALDPTAIVAADPGRLTQVFINLLVNAAHAVADLPPERRRIDVRVWREGEWAVGEVSDTGGGIPLEVLPRIFDPFFTTKLERGTGLGLAISRGIVARFGGELLVARTGAEGTVFQVRLPAEQPEPSSPARGPQ